MTSAKTQYGTGSGRDLPKLCRPPFLTELRHDRPREIDVGRSLYELLGIGWSSLPIDSSSLELLIYCDLRTGLGSYNYGIY
jgi:hypothetical protein